MFYQAGLIYTVFQKQNEKNLDPELKKITLLTFFYAISFGLLLIAF